jgi:hypothetical protein
MKKWFKKIFNKKDILDYISVEKLNLSEGDIVIITLPMMSSNAYAEYVFNLQKLIKEYKIFGDNKSIIIREDISLTKIDPESLLEQLK